jgi:hypothetical protein
MCPPRAKCEHTQAGQQQTNDHQQNRYQPALDLSDPGEIARGSWHADSPCRRRLLAQGAGWPRVFAALLAWRPDGLRRWRTRPFDDVLQAAQLADRRVAQAALLQRCRYIGQTGAAGQQKRPDRQATGKKKYGTAKLHLRCSALIKEIGHQKEVPP